MAAAGNTEFFVKMNRMVLPELETSLQPLPVKFRSVLFDPHHDESKSSKVEEEENEESDYEINSEETKENQHHFFKVPMLQKYLYLF